MRREGAGDDNLTMADFLCDFCRAAWTEDRPMVEGHQGACVCGRCLSVAWTELVLAGGGETLGQGEACRLCLEPTDRMVWRSPAEPEAAVCVRCVKQAAGALHKDPDIDWRKPSDGGAQEQA